MNYTWKRRKRSAWKGVVAGIVGGVAGAYTMGLFYQLCEKASAKYNTPEGHKEFEDASEDSQEATSRLADRAARPVLGRRLRFHERKNVKPYVHYGFGTAVGALYGVTSEYAPVVKKFAGAPYGAAVFAGAHEAALPALHLTGKPNDYPLTHHATELGSHVVYGVTLEGVRRLVRKILRA